MLSIVIPVYNGEKYIERCIDSALEQGPVVREIVVIDDGSTDRTAQVVKRCAEKNPKVVLHGKENGGVSSARNLGLKRISGKYVWFLDADDILLAGAAEQLIRRMEKQHAQIGIGNCVYYFPEKNEKRKTEIWMEDGVWTDRKIEILHYYEIPSNKIFSREFLLENHLEFPKLKIGEDTCFFSKCVSKSDCIVTAEKCVCLYRMHEDNSSRKYNLSVLGKIKAFDEIRAFFIENQMSQEWLDRLTFNQLYHYCDVLKKLPLFENPKERREVLQCFSGALSGFDLEKLKKEPLTGKTAEQIQRYLRFQKLYASQAVSRLFLLARSAKHTLAGVKHSISGLRRKQNDEG